MIEKVMEPNFYRILYGVNSLEVWVHTLTNDNNKFIWYNSVIFSFEHREVLGYSMGNYHEKIRLEAIKRQC